MKGKATETCSLVVQSQASEQREAQKSGGGPFKVLSQSPRLASLLHGRVRPTPDVDSSLRGIDAAVLHVIARLLMV